MVNKGMKKIQKKFLKKLYKRGGCVEISWIKDFFYGMDEEMLIKNVINELVEQGKCVVENMPSEEGEERNIVFITTCGLTEIKGADDPVNWKSENLTYERRCHGYSSVLEYYEKEKDKINFYSSVTGFFCRGMMYVSMMVKDNYKNVRKEMLLEGKKFVDERCQKEDYSSEIHITVLRTVLNKLIEDIDKECFDKEAHEADIMLDRIMQQRQRCFDEYRYYKE